MTEKDNEVKDLRDYFAGKALECTLSTGYTVSKRSDYAEWCYEMADAMMEARKQSHSNNAKTVNVYIDVSNGVVDTISGDAAPNGVKLVFHVRDFDAIKQEDQTDPAPDRYEPEQVYL